MTEYTRGQCHDGGDCLRVNGSCQPGRCDRREVAMPTKTWLEPVGQNIETQLQVAEILAMEKARKEAAANKAWLDEAMRLSYVCCMRYSQWQLNECESKAEYVQGRLALRNHLEKRP